MYKDSEIIVKVPQRKKHLLPRCKCQNSFLIASPIQRINPLIPPSWVYQEIYKIIFCKGGLILRGKCARHPFIVFESSIKAFNIMSKVPGAE